VPAAGGGVAAVVVDDVGTGVSDLGGCRKQAHVVALGEDRALATGQAIEASRHPDREGLHATGERRVAVGLDDEVQVRALDAPIDDAKALAGTRGAQRAADDVRTPLGAKARKLPMHAQGDVHRRAPAHPRAPPMQHPLVAAIATGPPCAGPKAAAAEAEQALLGISSFGHGRFDYGQIYSSRV